MADLSADTPVRLDTDGVGPFVLRVSGYPPGYLPPLEATEQIFFDQEHLEFDLDLELLSGTNRETVRLLSATRVVGHVLDEAGRGVGDVLVCARLQGLSQPKNHYGTTDASGFYSIDCPPGSVRLQVYIKRDHPRASTARPLPREMNLHAHSAQVVDFSLTDEGGRIVGRIVDQDGGAVEGMYVLCTFRPDQSHLPKDRRLVYTQKDYIQSARSDADGRFTLAGLPAGRFGVNVGPEDYQPVGKGRLGMLIPIRTVDVGEREQVDLGQIDAWTSRPFRLSGRVDLTGRWVERANAVGNFRLFAILQAGARRSRVREEPIPLRHVAGVLDFEWACETPEELVLLELRGPDGLLVQEPVWPIPDEVAQVLLRLPR